MMENEIKRKDMKKWDYNIKVIGIAEDKVEETLEALEEMLRERGLRFVFGLGEESENGKSNE